MTAFFEYVTSNKNGIIQDTVFSFVGVLLGILFSPKNNNSLTGNGTSIHQTIQLIQQNIFYSTSPSPRSSQQRSKPQKKTDSDDTTFGVLLIGAIVLAFFFYIYHSIIMTYFSGFIFLALTSTITIAIKLYMNNQYDNLNRFWTILASFFIAIDYTTLILMKKQVDPAIKVKSIPDFISVFGMDGILKYSYYAFGFVFIIVVNVMLAILLLHMFAVNHNLNRGGRVSAYIIRKTSPLTIKPTFVAVIGLIVCTVSILFTSGILYNLVQHSISAQSMKISGITQNQIE